MRPLSELLADVDRLGITLQAEGDGGLRVRGAVGSINASLRAELKARKSELLAALAGPAARPIGPRRDSEAPTPLTFNQRRLWFIEKLSESGRSFTMSAAWELRGTLDVAALQRALSTVTKRHAILRARIVEDGTEPQLLVAPWSPFALAEENASAETVDALLRAEAEKPFDLAEGHLFRVRLVRFAKDRRLLLVSLHHLISDQWSMGVLIGELSALLSAEAAGQTGELPPLPLQFADFAAWQREYLSESVLASELAYWRKRLENAVTDLALPFDRPRPRERGLRGAVHRFEIPAQADLGRIAAGRRASTFMAYLAVYAALLARWTGQEELIVGCPLGNREHPETHGLIGFFVNTVALRLDLSGDPDFMTLLDRTREASLESFVHQAAPFDRVVDALRPQRYLNRNPLFQAMFVLQNAETKSLVWPGVEVVAIATPPMAPEVDINLMVNPPDRPGGSYMGYLEYDPDLFEPASIERFSRQFVALARAVARQPQMPLSRLPIEDDPVASWLGPRQLPPTEQRLDALILQRLRSQPLAPALIASNGDIVRAGVLADRASTIAALLLEEGVRPGQVVGVCLPRGAEMIAGMLGILKAGCAFVVLPADSPVGHLESIANTARIELAIADEATAAKLPPLVRPFFVGGRAHTSSEAQSGGALAYVCFTSGSSGVPKGVAVDHAALINHVTSVVEAFALTPEDRVLQFAAPSFDVALEEIFPTLLAGATVVLPPAEGFDSLDAFARMLDDRQVTVANLPSPFWHAWVRELDEAAQIPPRSLRLLVTGSDRVQTAALERWRRIAPDVVWLSGYGPTEATVTATLFDPRRDPVPAGATTVPLGRPIANVDVHVVDTSGLPVPTGVVGEIVIEGAGIARGYLGAASESGFRPRTKDGPRAYWTGDLGRRRADGSLEFLGRRDGQLKIRGIRIEPSAVEAALMAHPDVGEVAVAGRPDGQGGLQLWAAITGTVEGEALRSWVRAQLPAHMVPSVIERVSNLPKLTSGKIDRRALITLRSAARPPSSAPLLDERQRVIADIFAAILERSDVGPESNFFELGGDSIRSLQIVARARRAGLALTVRAIFQHQTVAAIAASISDVGDPDGPSGAGPVPLTPILSWFLKEVGGDWHHFNQAVMLEVPKGADGAAMQAALAALVRCHDILRLVVVDHDGNVRCEVPEDGAPPELTVLDLSDLDEETRKVRRAECFSAVQSGLDPRLGRNVGAVLLPDEGRLLLTIHHLCVDVLSWGALLEDLEAAYGAAASGQSPQLRRSATSFRQWAERLTGLAAAMDQGDLSYWLEQLARPADRLLPEAGADPGLDGSARSCRRDLDRPLTVDITRTAPAVFGARPDEVILAALLKVIHRRGGTRVRVDLERNGRISPFDDLDLSRTVGWFTAVLPLLLECDDTQPAELVRAVGRMVADSPQNGLGFGLLRYCSPGKAGEILAAIPAAEILLNFVGTLGEWNGGAFRPVDEYCGPTIAPTLARTHPLELNAGVIDGRLRLDLQYSGSTGCDEQASALLDDIVQALEEIASAGRVARAGILVPADVEEVLALTPLQHGILLHSLREQETYFNQLHLTLHGPLDAEALRAAWNQVAARHQALRASFRHGADGTPLQLIHAVAEPAWIEKDWRLLGAEEQKRRLAALLVADRATGFDLERPPLMRLYLIQTEAERHELVWSAHHLLLDGWSVSVVLGEVAALYRQACGGPPAGLPTAPDFGRYITWLGSADSTAATAFWREDLGLVTERCLLAGPGLAPSSDEPMDGDNHTALRLAPDDVRAIETLARAAGVTVALVLQAAWSLLLSRYTGLKHVSFALTVSGRPPELPGAETMVGMLINTLPVGVSVPRRKPILDWLRELGDRAIERAKFSTTPLAAALAAAGHSPGAPPFDSLVLFQNYPLPKDLGTGDLKITLGHIAEATNFPITLVGSWGAQPGLLVMRDPRRVSHAAGHQLLGHVVNLLRALCRDPAASVEHVSVHSPDELGKRVALGIGAASEVSSLFAHEYLDEWAVLAPDLPAVVSADGALTYGELASRADRLAAHLAELGIGPGSRVALAAPRSTKLVAAFMAILKSGAAVVPLDPAYPRDRLSFMLEDSAADLVVTHGACREHLPINDRLPVLLLEDETAVPSRPWQPRKIAPQSPAYVIYTSGSTGRPKGVLSPHGGLRALISAQRAVFALGPGDRVLQFASLSFDASVWEIVMALGAGATLHLPSREEALAGDDLGVYLRRHRISAATLPPSLLGTIPEGDYPDLRVLAVAGEPCPPALARRWATGRRFFNAYGPSETTVCATIFEGGGDGVNLPIGRAIPNVSAHVVDARLEPVPLGCEGELLIGGAGIALGYIDRPDLSAGRFIADPFIGTSGARLYRTGDRVRIARDGTLLFRGRIDRQIKLRGFRIEPGEIEAALASRPEVAHALAGVRADATGEERLLAWVLPASNHRLDPESLRRILKSALPGHMVPAAVIVIDTVPLTPNGKVDWDALPADADAQAEPHKGLASSAAPKNETGEATLRREISTLWCELLDRPHVEPDQQFFDIGGHSLLLVQLQRLLKSRFGVSLPVTELFGHLTVRSLARRLAAAGAVAPAETMAPDSSEPVAIIGVCGRFPGAPDIDSFWRMLVEEREGISRFGGDDATRASVGAQQKPGGQLFVPALGMITDAEAFDPAVFGLSARDSLVLDPQHRIFLQCAWHALEDAGYAPGSTRDVVGVFGGSGLNTWLREVLVPAGEDLSGSAGFHLMTSNEKDFLVSKAAYHLDFKGPAVAVQTACSTSLVAVVMAVDALQAGRCGMALAGGVSITFPQKQGYSYEPDMILSPDGHCRPFSAAAAGTVPGAGAGVVVLKTLSRARADGDRVIAVIRGGACGNDGINKVGFTAPGVEGQAATIRAALAAAGLEAKDIDYVEAHGTGTALGDPVEITALSRVFGGRTEPLLIGSVKSNIGHADTAAGIAGLIKTALALKRNTLPASLHALPPNPRIDFAAGPFEVVDRTRRWPARDRPLRAGVSSFGIGGTNAHVILEAAPSVPDERGAVAASESRTEVLALSAQTETALVKQAENLAVHLREASDERLTDIAFTLQCGRAQLRHRRAVVARTGAEAASALELPDGGIFGRARAQPPQVALLLPGQGSQHPRMGHALYVDAGSVFRRELDTISEALQPLLGMSLTGLLYDTSTDPKILRRTEIAQPLVFALTVSLARHWQALGLKINGMLGHSVGEYAAAYLADVFTLEDALALMVERGRLIAALPEGAMLAVGAPEDQVRQLLGDRLSLAAVNGARQCVVSGPESAIAELEEILLRSGRPVRRLSTSHAFHSQMMAPAADALARAIARLKPKPPRLRFVSNVSGTWITAAQAVDPAYWARHLLEPVRFADGLATLRDAGIELAVECGPGQTLSGLVPGSGLKALPSLAHAAEAPAGGSRIADTAARLWVEHVPIELTRLSREPRRRVSLPLYPFERLLFRPEAKRSADVAAPSTLLKRPRIAEWFYRPGWAAASSGNAVGLEGPWLILSDRAGVGAKLAAELKREGSMVTLVERGAGFSCNGPRRFTVRAAEAQDFLRLFADQAAPPRRLLHLWGLDAGHAEELQETGFHTLVALMRASGRTWSGHALRLDVATCGGTDIGGRDALRPELAAAIGAVKVLPYEYPDLVACAIDLEHDSPARMAERLRVELALDGVEPVVALRDDGRWAPAIWPQPLTETAEPAPNSVVLITGAFGGMGAAIARDFARVPGMRLILLGRQPLPKREYWPQLISASDPIAPRLRLVCELEAAGAQIMTEALDIADATALARVVDAAVQRFGAITGVVHAAGLADLGGVVHTRARSDSERVLAPKIAGTRALEQGLGSQPIEFLVLCSTLGSLLPAAKFGQIAYAAANDYLDVAAAAIAKRTGWHTVTVNWDDWVEAGMTVEAHRARGAPTPTKTDGLTHDEGTAVLRRILAYRDRRIVVSVRDLPSMMAGAKARFDKTTHRFPAKGMPGANPLAPGAEHALRSAAVRDVDNDALTAQLTGAFARILEQPDIGPEDSFFEAGGHSLLAMRVLAFARETLGISIGIAAIFDHPTPRSLAAYIRERLAGDAYSDNS